MPFASILSYLYRKNMKSKRKLTTITIKINELTCRDLSKADRRSVFCWSADTDNNISQTPNYKPARARTKLQYAAVIAMRPIITRNTESAKWTLSIRVRPPTTHNIWVDEKYNSLTRRSARSFDHHLAEPHRFGDVVGAKAHHHRVRVAVDHLRKKP